jgi:hypothetical protein
MYHYETDYVVDRITHSVQKGKAMYMDCVVLYLTQALSQPGGEVGSLSDPV